MRVEPGGAPSLFGGALAVIARAIIDDARRALADPELKQAEAVHEVRKALKRWRALLRLLTRPLGEPADQMRSEARDLMRSLAGARDAQSALDALHDLRKTEPALSATSVKTVHDRMATIRDAAELKSVTPALRERLNRYLDYATLSMERWPLNEIDFDTVADGLTATYRRTRQLIPENWTEADAEQLHTLRRRVVEHRHQMELVEHLWPRLGQVWAEEAQRLRDRLGACQDLVVLERLTAPHQALAHWRSRLTPAIAARRGSHLKTAERLTGRLFAEKPKAFRRRIGALWNHSGKPGSAKAKAKA